MTFGTLSDGQRRQNEGNRIVIIASKFQKTFFSLGIVS